MTSNESSNVEWEAHKDEEGTTYYYNRATDETQWEKPTTGKIIEVDDDNEGSSDNNKNTESTIEADSKTSATKKWTKHLDDDGRVYYYNEDTDETQWDKPLDYQSDTANDDEKTKKSGRWTKHTDDDGREYFYNEETEETQWEKPADYDDENDVGDENDKPPKEDSNDDTTQPKSSAKIWTKHTNDDGNEYYFNETTEETQWERPEDYTSDADVKTTPKRQPSTWTKHKDDDDREYYYNEDTGETQWDKPDDYTEEQEQDAKKETPVPSSKKGTWTKHKDDDGNEYYFNEVTNETQWEKPPDLQEEEQQEEKKEKAEITEKNDEQKTAEVQVEAAPKEEPEEPPEPEIDPAVKKLQDAEQALNQPDAIMEPDCLDHVGELLSSLGGAEGGQKAMQSLISSYHGETAICGLLGIWLSDVKGNSQKAMDHVRDLTLDVVGKLARERFTTARGDKIFNLARSEAIFLDEMMASSQWRKLLIDLSAKHRDSQLLSFCLSNISKMGHHREIAKRINQSDHFPVYNAMLASELAVVGQGGEFEGIKMSDLLEDLRRTCTSTSYTYLYAVEALRFLVNKAKAEHPDNPTITMAIRKWTRLREELTSAMVDPSNASSSSSNLYRKRRRDIALTVSELHQRQRRRLKPGEGTRVPDAKEAELCRFEVGLSTLLLRHAENKKFDEPLLDQLISSGEAANEQEIGSLLNCHPLVTKALLGHLFLPGANRVSSLMTRSKCARLLAFAVVAAEGASVAKNGDKDNQAADKEARKEEIKSQMLQGSQLCELVENMVSFSVTSDINHKEENPSAGVKLCIFAIKSAPVAQGVAMWANELVNGSGFSSSASFPTLAPCLMSLLRIIVVRHPFTRPLILSTSLAFLGLSNPDVSYQKTNELKRQALRLLVFLLVQGEVAGVCGKFAGRLKKTGTTELDATLVRYFLGSILDTVNPPYSLVMVRSFSDLLTTAKCVDAIKSSYFAPDKKAKLTDLIRHFKAFASKDTCSKSTKDLVDKLVKTYS